MVNRYEPIFWLGILDFGSWIGSFQAEQPELVDVNDEEFGEGENWGSSSGNVHDEEYGDAEQGENSEAMQGWTVIDDGVDEQEMADEYSANGQDSYMDHNYPSSTAIIQPRGQPAARTPLLEVSAFLIGLGRHFFVSLGYIPSSRDPESMGYIPRAWDILIISFYFRLCSAISSIAQIHKQPKHFKSPHPLRVMASQLFHLPKKIQEL